MLSVADVLMYLEEMFMMWVRHVKIPAARLPFGGKAVRIHGTSPWNKLHTSVVPFRLKKCFKKNILKNKYIWSYLNRMRYSYIHSYNVIGTHETPNNPVFYCCSMLLVTSLMSICFTGNHRQCTLFDYIVKLCFVVLYSCLLLAINLLLLLLLLLLPLPQPLPLPLPLLLLATVGCCSMWPARPTIKISSLDHSML